MFVCICKTFNRRFLLLVAFFVFKQFFFLCGPFNLLYHTYTYIIASVSSFDIVITFIYSCAIWLLCISMLFALTSFGQCDLQPRIATSENAVHSIFQWMDNVLEWHCCCYFHFIRSYTMLFFVCSHCSRAFALFWISFSEKCMKYKSCFFSLSLSFSLCVFV